MKKIVLVFLIFKIISGEGCDKGCLKCSSGDCIYCDIKEEYYRVRNMCSLKKLDFCKTSENGEVCEQCEKGYYRNFLTGQCIKVTSSSEVEKCSYYNFENDCSECDEGYYFQDKKCVEVENIIENCVNYESNTKCSKCEDNYNLNFEQTQCISNEFENCLNFGTLTCKKCKNGYQLYKNAYLFHLEQMSILKQKKVDIYNLSENYFSYCAKQQVENCKRYGDNFYECEECEIGFILTIDRLCTNNPKIIIENCKQYLRERECRECLQGFYLDPNDKESCLPHSKTVDLCLKMSITNKDECFECQSDYYVVNNICVKRSQTIQNCVQYKNDGDFCEVCEEGFQLTTSKILCLIKIRNCEILKVESSSISCEKCNKNYYFKQSTNTCVAVTENQKSNFVNCEYFKEDLESNAVEGMQCQQCSQKYYAENDANNKIVCKSNAAFTKDQVLCEKWSTTEANKCVSCEQKNFLLNISNFCEAVPQDSLDENALFYEENQNKSKISECKEGFYLETTVVDGIEKYKCVKISIDQCSRQNQLQCEECSQTQVENYVLDSLQNQNKCILSYTHVKKNCTSSTQIQEYVQVESDSTGNQQQSTTKLYSNVCKSCNSPYYPLQIHSSSFCIERETIRKNFENNDKMVNCQIYQPIENKCFKCNKVNNVQWVLDDGVCKESCTNGRKILIRNYKNTWEQNDDENIEYFDFSVEEEQFICVNKASSLNGCKYIAMLIDLDKENTVDTKKQPVYKCVQCEDQFLPELDETTPWRYHIKFDLQPGRATGNFQIENQSFESDFNQIEVFEKCNQIVLESTGAKISALSLSKQYFKPGEQFQSISKQPDYNANSNFWKNCKSIGPKLKSKLFCRVCKFGYYGYFMELEAAQNAEIKHFTNFMMSECVLNPHCNMSTYYKGLNDLYINQLKIRSLKVNFKEEESDQFNELGSFLNFWTTCHKCNPINGIETIPTVTYSRIGFKFTATNTNSISYNILINNNTILKVNYKYTDQIIPQSYCDIPGFIRNNVNSMASVNAEFPQNCGVQFIDHKIKLTKLTTGTLANNSANPICVACKPGFKPETVVINNSSIKTIIKCVEIINCDDAGKDTFNKCTQCISNYVLNENFDECIQLDAALPHCYQMKELTSQNGSIKRCIKCNKGYIINHDFTYCNKIEFNNCVNSSIFEGIYLNQLSVVNSYKGNGCYECEVGYVSATFKSDKYTYPQQVCVKSEQVESSDFTKTGIKDCVVYTGEKTCSECIFGKLVVTKRKSQNNTITEYMECVDNSIIPNCQDISHDFNPSNPSKDIWTCNKCKDFYVKINNECKEGKKYIQNCKIFDSTSECQECEEGFLAMKVNLQNNQNQDADTKKLCFSVKNKIKKCTSYIFNQQSKILNCSQCENEYFPQKIQNAEGVSSLTKIEVCIGKNLVDYCKTYGIDQCEECQDDYYIQQYPESGLIYCEKRTNNDDSFCEKFSINEDVCEICKDSYYIRGNKCEFKPVGIKGCIKYSDQTDCLQCNQNMFLQNNRCVEVEPANIILNCIYYSSSNSCLECQQGYGVFNEKCEALLISNCETFESPSKCQICSNQFFLTAAKTCDSGKVVNCEQHESINICQKCQPNNFLNQDKRCSVVESPIPNCEYYKSETECMECTNGSILEKDGTCLKIESTSENQQLKIQRDENCDSYEYEITCRVCKEGYKFVNGKCEKCSPTIATSCHFCHYRYDDQCLYCKHKYYMKDNLDCVTTDNSSDDINSDSTIDEVPDIKNDWQYSVSFLILVAEIMLLI